MADSAEINSTKLHPSVCLHSAVDSVLDTLLVWMVCVHAMMPVHVGSWL